MLMLRTRKFVPEADGEVFTKAYDGYATAVASSCDPSSAECIGFPGCLCLSKSYSLRKPDNKDDDDDSDDDSSDDDGAGPNPMMMLMMLSLGCS